MRRVASRGIAFVAVLAVSFVGTAAWARTEATATAPPQPTTGPPLVAQQPEIVSFCHGTTSVANPYDVETTTVDSVVEQGHGSHAGPVFPAVGPDGTWGDIIPPFDYDDGQQHFPGLNWPAGSAVLEAGCAVHATNETSLAPTPCDDCAPTPTVTKPNIVVNVSCRSRMNLDVTFNEEPPSPWTLIVFIDGVQQFTLVDDDSDLMGFHPKIEADQLPQTSYTYSVDATNAGQTFIGIASGNVVCETPPPTTARTTTTAAPTTTTARQPRRPRQPPRPADRPRQPRRPRRPPRRPPRPRQPRRRADHHDDHDDRADHHDTAADHHDDRADHHDAAADHHDDRADHHDTAANHHDRRPTTTTQPTTTTTAPTTTTRPTTTTAPSTSTSSPSTGTSTTTSAVAASTTVAPSSSSTTTTTTAAGLTTTTGPAAGGSTTSVAGVTTTTIPGATAAGSTTTTTTPPPAGSPPPTAGLTLQDLPPVSALALGEALPDPPPRVLAFVISRGNTSSSSGSSAGTRYEPCTANLPSGGWPTPGTTPARSHWSPCSCSSVAVPFSGCRVGEGRPDPSHRRSICSGSRARRLRSPRQPATRRMRPGRAPARFNRRPAKHQMCRSGAAARARKSPTRPAVSRLSSLRVRATGWARAARRVGGAAAS